MKENHEKIMRLLLYKGNLDRSLKHLSNALFDLDKKSRSILQILAEKGPSTEYQLGKIGKEFELDRDSVRRRIIGTKSIKGLEKQEFVWIAEKEKFRTGETKKVYNLTVKGIFASLDRVPFERNYAIKQFYSLITAITENEYHIADFILQQIKFQIGILMSWYKMNGFNLTGVRDFSNLFGKNMIKHYLSSQIPNSLLGKRHWQDFEAIGCQFIELHHIVKTLLNRILTDKNFRIYSNEYFLSLAVKHHVKKTLPDVKKLFENIIFRDWYMYATSPDEISLKKIRSSRFGYQSDTPQKLDWFAFEGKMNFNTQKIFQKFNIDDFKKIDVEKLL